MLLYSCTVDTTTNHTKITKFQTKSDKRIKVWTELQMMEMAWRTNGQRPSEDEEEADVKSSVGFI